jgi:hypothetical protein
MEEQRPKKLVNQAHDAIRLKHCSIRLRFSSYWYHKLGGRRERPETMLRFSKRAVSGKTYSIRG